MPIQSAWSDERDTRQALREAYAALRRKLRGDADFLFLTFGAAHLPEDMAAALSELPETVRVLGGAGYNGLITEDRVLTGPACLGLLGSRMSDLNMGMAAAPRGQDMKAAAQAAVLAAMADAGRVGELPNAVLFTSSPGDEERILAGLNEVVGDNVPVYGGGACADLETKNSTVVANRTVEPCGIAVGVVYGDGLKSMSFHSGYVPSNYGGMVTALDGPRRIMTIDDRPAADVYRDWYKGQFGQDLPETAGMDDVLALAPIGRQIGRLEHLDLFALSAILKLDDDGGVQMLTDIEPGQTIRLMVGMRETMASRPARAINTAVELEGLSRIHGSMVAFCAFLACYLHDDLEAVRRNMCMAMMGRPFLVVFSCGEQGVLHDYRPVNGNLMVSALVFGT